MLDGGGLRRGSSPFKYENMWLVGGGVQRFAKELVGGLNFNGSHSFVLATKLRALKAVLKSWNIEVFNFIEARKGATLSQVVFCRLQPCL